MPSLVLDANILIRGVLGNKVRDLLITHHQNVDFFTPDVSMDDAKKYLPMLFEKRKLPSQLALTLLSNLNSVVQIVEQGLYKEYMNEAKRRMKGRDIQDWPIAATALALNSAIWTEDKDFFGSGFPTWTTNKIHIFFEMS